MTRDEAIEYLETLEASDEIKNPLGLLDSLRTVRDEAKTNREALEEANEKIGQLEKFKGGSKNVAIARELKAQGVKNPERVAKLMNLDDIDFDDEGDLVGFEEAFETTKTDWPELFETKRRAGNIDQHARGDIEPKLSATQQQIALLHQAQSGR